MADKAKSKDLGEAELQSAFTEADKQGGFGVKVDPIPEERYSVQSGPDSPSALEQHVGALRQRADHLEQGKGADRA